MRTAALVLTLAASFALSGCATALYAPPRDASPDGFWKNRAVHVAPSSGMFPTVDTSVQRDALRRGPQVPIGSMVRDSPGRRP